MQEKIQELGFTVTFFTNKKRVKVICTKGSKEFIGTGRTGKSALSDAYNQILEYC